MEHKKIKNPNCPKCGKPMRLIVPISMAVCDECGEKYYVEKMGDEYVVLGEYYEVKAQKMKEMQTKDEEDEKSETEEPMQEEESEEVAEEEEKPEVEEPEEESVVSQEEKKEDEPQEEKEEQEVKVVEKESTQLATDLLPPLIEEDSRYIEFKRLVEKYVTRKYWVQVAKDELKKMVSELYDAGALSDNFNPSHVARVLLNSDGESMVLPFFGIEWLDKAVTRELLTRIWLKLQGYKEIIRLEKLKFYIAIFHPEDLQSFLDGRLDEIKVKKYIYEMEAIEQ